MMGVLKTMWFFFFEIEVTVFCFLSGASNVKPLDGVKILDLTRFVFCLSFVTVYLNANILNEKAKKTIFFFFSY